MTHVDTIDELLAGSHRSLARLQAVIASLDDRALGQPTPSGWSVAATLAHLAFYDDWVSERWRRCLATGELQDLPDDITELANVAGKRGWQAIDPEVAKIIAADAAEAMVGFLGTLPRAALEQAIGAGRYAMIDRSVHWDPHLDEIERASRR
jgi:hypothetical protein